MVKIQQTYCSLLVTSPDLWPEGPNVVDVVGWLVRELVEEEIVAGVDWHEPLQVSREAATEHPGLVVSGQKCLPNTCTTGM